MEKVDRTALLSGILIGVGVIINLSAGNKYIGAMLFSLALLTIIRCNLQLYTGRIGFAINRRHSVRDYIDILLLNFIGVSVSLLWFYSQDSETQQKVLDISAAKFAHSYAQIFFCGVMCGVLMFVAVKCKNTVITIFCIMTFILSGYEHCIADFPFFVLGGMSVEKALKFLLIILGNSVGSILTNILSHGEAKVEEYGAP
jgi:formate/nitrite transporter FocA (FNT family)